MVRLVSTIALLFLPSTVIPLAGSAYAQELRVVPSIDPERYCGTWYEIARLPNRFQNECAGDVTATYSLLDNGELRVVNRWRKNSGEFIEASGIARKADQDGPESRLEVRFAPAFLSFLPFVWGDYWIIDLAGDYSYAVIGEPDREYFWVLSRSQEMDPEQLSGILARAREQGYNLNALTMTAHTR